MGLFSNKISEDQRSEAAGAAQRNADNKAGSKGKNDGGAKNELAYERGYREHGDKQLPDWMVWLSPLSCPALTPVGTGHGAMWKPAEGGPR